MGAEQVILGPTSPSSGADLGRRGHPPRRPHGKHARIIVSALGGLLVVVSALWQLSGWLVPGHVPGTYVPRPPFARPVPLNTFTKHGVTVDLALETDSAGQAILAARYTPLREHFHLYSKELPRVGLHGAGRPTLLELPPTSSLQTLGPLTADLPSQDYQIEGFPQPFPIYPEGPVTLRLPIAGAEVRATLLLTYMSCSSTGICLPPVEAEPVALALPGTPGP